MTSNHPVQIFISYKKDDEAGDGRGREFVKALKQAIVQSALSQGEAVPDVWYDQEIESGARWEDEIRRRLHSAEVMVLVYTPEFFAPGGYILSEEIPLIMKRLEDLQVVQIVRRPVILEENFFSTKLIPEGLRALDPENDGRPFGDFEDEDFTKTLSLTADNVIAATKRAFASRQTTQVRPVLEEYINKVNKRLSRRDRAAPEDQLKYPLQECLDSIGPLLSKRRLTTRTEDAQTTDDVVSHVRLDIAIIDESSGYRVGHMELKSPEKGANPTKARGKGNWSDHDKLQWKKLQEHPNLLYCNGFEWTLIRDGIQIDHVDLEDYSRSRLTDQGVKQFTELVGNFVTWRPIAPRTAQSLAKRLAPLARILREAVAFEISRAANSHNPSRSQLVRLHNTWQQTLMPDATEADFADSVAQTFTYALLLARLNDRIMLPLNSDDVAKSLRVHGHRLLGSVLDLLADPEVRRPINEQIGLVETAIASVDPTKLKSRKDTWLYFYEDFLAEYDPKRRKDAGVYYTPLEVVGAQVRMIDHALKTRFNKSTGLGDPDVKVLDPATGTGTYLLSTIDHVLDAAEMSIEKSSDQAGLGTRAAREAVSRRLATTADSLKDRLFGFELLIGAYSVAHLRLTKRLTDAGAALRDSGVGVYLTDTLASPREGHGTLSQPPLFWGTTQQAIIAEQQESDAVKSDQEKITVILGNPPYNRTNKEAGQGAGGKETRNMVLSGNDELAPLIDDFRDPVMRAGNGRSLKHNLNDPYIYFLRWSIWKACEQDPTDPAIVSFITNSSYLRSVPFAGVREHMRRHFDEIWFIDLGGGGRGPRKEANVFAIQTSVAIFVGIQRPIAKNKNGVISQKARESKRTTPAKVWYRRIEGTRRDKLDALNNLSDLRSDDTAWTMVNDETLSDFATRFVPSGKSDFWGWPTLDKLLPWAHSGAQYTRTWPIAPDPDTLRDRWDDLFVTGKPDPAKFKEGRDRKINSRKTDLLSGSSLPALSDQDAVKSLVTPVRYAFRSFDRMWCLPDARLGDYLRVPLWQSYSNKQVYLTSLQSTPLGIGPAATVSAHVPDLHHFRGSYGTRDVFPALRTGTTEDPNSNKAFLELLSDTYGETASPESVFAYIVGVLGTSAYTERFFTDLGESPVRVPITKSAEVFREVSAFGRALIAVETYEERFADALPAGLSGASRLERSPSIGEYPDQFSYDAASETLTVGEGYFSNVTTAVWNFEVSGLRVISSWLGYRMSIKTGLAGPLDDIQPVKWTFDTELTQLLWAVEYVAGAADIGTNLFDRILSGDVFTDTEIPVPAPDETAAPTDGGDTLV